MRDSSCWLPYQLHYLAHQLQIPVCMCPSVTVETRVHCKNDWPLSRLQTSWGDSGYEKFVLLEANCISNLSPKCTLQLTNICERVTTTTLQKYNAFAVTLSQMFGGYYICKIMCYYCMLSDTSRCDHSQMFSGYYICKILLVRWSGKLPLWLSYAISKIHTTYPLSLQLMCNQVNHSVIKTTNLFLQWKWRIYICVYVDRYTHHFKNYSVKKSSWVVILLSVHWPTVYFMLSWWWKVLHHYHIHFFVLYTLA